MTSAVIIWMIACEFVLFRVRKNVHVNWHLMTKVLKNFRHDIWGTDDFVPLWLGLFLNNFLSDFQRQSTQHFLFQNFHFTILLSYNENHVHILLYINIHSPSIHLRSKHSNWDNSKSSNRQYHQQFAIQLFNMYLSMFNKYTCSIILVLLRQLLQW